MKNWYKSRTIWLAILQAVIGIVVVFETHYPNVGALVIFKSIIDVIIRTITSDPIG